MMARRFASRPLFMLDDKSGAYQIPSRVDDGYIELMRRAGCNGKVKQAVIVGAAFANGIGLIAPLVAQMDMNPSHRATGPINDPPHDISARTIGIVHNRWRQNIGATVQTGQCNGWL